MRLFTLQLVITGKIKTEKFLPKQGKRTHTQKVLSHVQCLVLQRLDKFMLFLQRMVEPGLKMDYTYLTILRFFRGGKGVYEG